MSLSDALDEVEAELGLEPITVSCDGNCGTELSRKDESYSQRVGDCEMLMLLCPQCAEEAGWINE
jgi:hypothetical protein